MFDEHTLIFVASKIEISYKVKKDLCHTESVAWSFNILVFAQSLVPALPVATPVEEFLSPF